MVRSKAHRQAGGVPGRRFADLVRREYLAVGIRMALHPQIDLATEPRWPRISGAFGEDAHPTAQLAVAYIIGFQGETLGAHSVACMTKHFPGGGPQDVLLLQGRPKIYVENVDPAVASQYTEVVATPAAADFAILRLDTPWTPVETQNPFARGVHHGDLDFKESTKSTILALLHSVPTIVVIYLDRPAVIPEINAAAQALLADFGASDVAVLDVIFGKVRPEGRLPFELPASMEAVCNQKADIPYDSEHRFTGLVLVWGEQAVGEGRNARGVMRVTWLTQHAPRNKEQFPPPSYPTPPRPLPRRRPAPGWQAGWRRASTR